MARETSNKKIRRQTPEDMRFPGLLVENSPEGMIICDKKGRIQLANPEFCRIFGHAIENVLGRDIDEAVSRSPEIRKKAKSLSARALKTPLILPEATLEKTDGSKVFVSVMAGPIRENGEIAGSYRIYRDITQRMDTERKIRREKAFFESLFQNSPGAIIICDERERIVEVNREFCRLFGYTEEEVKGKNGNEVVAQRPDLYREAEKLDRDMWASGDRVALETVRTRKDGSTVPVSIVQVPFSLEDGTMYDYSIYTDITERKLTEEALKKSEKRYQAIVNDQIEMVGRFRPDGTLIFGNPALAESLGLSADEMEGKNLFELLPREVAVPLQEDLAELSPENPCIFREHEYKTPSGRIRWERWSDIGIFNERGELVEIQGVGRDMTELKRSQEEQEHLNAVLKSIRGINRLINKQKDKRRLIQGICAHLIETRGYGNVWVALLEKRGNLATVTEAGINEQGRPMAETLEHEELNEWGRNVLKTPGVIVSKHASPRTDCPLLDNYSEKAIMTARLEHGGTVYGLISVSLPEGFSADDEEKNLFLEAAQDIAFALHAIDVYKDRETALQELQEKARQVEILLKDRPEGLWVWDREADRLFFNESYEKNLGYEPGELQPSRFRWETMIHPDDAERIKAFIASHLDDPSKGNTIEYEYRIRTKQGFWKWVTDRGHIVERDENGKAVRISGTQTVRDGGSCDIPFRESCQNLVDVLCRNPSEAVILHWGSDAPEGDRIFAASKAACEVTGFPAKELIGKKPADLLMRLDEGDTSRAAIRNSEGHQLPVTVKTVHFHVLGHPAAATFLKIKPHQKERVLQNQTD